MNFVSTRNKHLTVGFWESIVQGLTPDGGLLVPPVFGRLPKQLINSSLFWKELTPAIAAATLLRLFISPDEISAEDLYDLTSRALRFSLPSAGLSDNSLLLYLDQGPTASFKDIAARILAGLFGLYCERRGERIHLIVATSGDTGVAIASAFGNAQSVTVTVLYPADGVSEIQEKQMLWTGLRFRNVQVIPIRGNFDTCQDLAKTLQEARTVSTDRLARIIKKRFAISGQAPALTKLVETARALKLSSANSINIWRLIPQMTQYLIGYGELVKNGRITIGTEVVFAVPTGNVGHLMAGVYIQEMGLPIYRLIAGTNANNIFANVIGTGELKHRQFIQTSAPSMDILDPSNLERLLHFAAAKIGQRKVIDFSGMKASIKNPLRNNLSLRSYGVTTQALAWLQRQVWAEDVETNEEVFAMMRHLGAQSGQVLDPHATTAAIATIRARAKKAIAEDDQVVIFETAHPDKFPVALKAAGLRVPEGRRDRELSRFSLQKIDDLAKPKPSDPSPFAVMKLMTEFV